MEYPLSSKVSDLFRGFGFKPKFDVMAYKQWQDYFRFIEIKPNFNTWHTPPYNGAMTLLDINGSKHAGNHPYTVFGYNTNLWINPIRPEIYQETELIKHDYHLLMNSDEIVPEPEP